jgi:AcrR family transcriptional regulator
LEAAYKLLYRGGFSRVSMDSIALSAGVTKRTVYYHFDSKDSLTAAVLERQQTRALSLIRKWVGKSERHPSEFVLKLFRELEKWASRPIWLGSGFSRLTMELADMPGHPARVAAHRHKKSVEDWVADELATLGVADEGRTARQIVLLLEGSVTLTLIHRDCAYIRAAGEAAVRLLG